MTVDELSRWSQVSSDSEAEDFIRLFWARRDSVLGTTQNELKEAFERRVAYADDAFSTNGLRGSLSDRGKVYILLGPPSDRTWKRTEGHAAQVKPTSRTTGYVSRSEAMARELGIRPRANPLSEEFAPGTTVSVEGVPREQWHYDVGVMPGDLSSKETTFVFVNDELVGSPGTTEAELSLGEFGAQGVLGKAVREWIRHPDLSLSIESKPLAAAVDALKSNRRGRWDDLHLYYGEFVRPAGLVRTLPETFISLQAYHAGGAETPVLVTFFGELSDSEGIVVRAWEELVTLEPLGDDAWCDISFEIPEGVYEGVYGLAVVDRPIAVGRIDIKVKGTSTPETGVSRLILSTDIRALPSAQQAIAPFAFGGLKVIPKGDVTFRSGDQLWYFVEIRNPGGSPSRTGDEAADINSSTNETRPSKPLVQFSMGVTGTTLDGKTVKMTAPLAPAPLMRVKGADGHYCMGGSIPVSSIEPGTYTIRLSLYDSILNAWHHLGENFRVVD